MRKVRAAKPRDEEYKLTDSHRLYLLVKPGRSKTVELEPLVWRQAEHHALRRPSEGFPRGCTGQARRSLGTVLKPLRKGRQPASTDLVRLRAVIIAAEEDYAHPITRLGLRFLALTAVQPSELRRPAGRVRGASEVRKTSWINRELDRYDSAVRHR